MWYLDVVKRILPSKHYVFKWLLVSKASIVNCLIRDDLLSFIYTIITTFDIYIFKPCNYLFIYSNI